MNAYLNAVIQNFQYGRLHLKKTLDLSDYIMHPHEYWDRLIEPPAQEIRYLHEEYETELHECAYCARLYEAERDSDGWFKSWCCDECYALRDEGRD